MNLEIIASFLTGTIVTAIINKIFDIYHEERDAILKKKEIHFNHKIKAAEDTMARFIAVLTNLKGLKNCYQNYGDRLLSGKNISYGLLQESVNSFSANFNAINSLFVSDLNKIALYIDTPEKELKKADEIIIHFYNGLEDLNRFYVIFNSEKPCEEDEYKKQIIELFECLKSFVSVCSNLEDYLIHEITELRNKFKKYD